MMPSIAQALSNKTKKASQERDGNPSSPPAKHKETDKATNEKTQPVDEPEGITVNQASGEKKRDDSLDMESKTLEDKSACKDINDAFGDRKSKVKTIVSDLTDISNRLNNKIARGEVMHPAESFDFLQKRIIAVLYDMVREADAEQSKLANEVRETNENVLPHLDVPKKYEDAKLRLLNDINLHIKARMHTAVSNGRRLKDILGAVGRQKELKSDECVLQMEVAREALWPMVKKSVEKALQDGNATFVKQEEDLHALRMEVAFLKSQTAKQALTINQHSLRFKKVVRENRELRRRVQEDELLIRVALLTKYRCKTKEHTYKQKDVTIQNVVNKLGKTWDEQQAIIHEQIINQYPIPIEKVLVKDIERVLKEVEAKNQEHKKWWEEWLKQKDESGE